MDDILFERDYFKIEHFEVSVSGQIIKFASKRGLPEWDQITPSMLLLNRYVNLATGSKVLYLGCNHGAGAYLVSQSCSSCSIWLTDIYSIALDMTKLTFLENGVSPPTIIDPARLPTELINSMDCVILDLPKGRDLSRRWLAMAHQALREGGFLYLSGANNLGIHSSIKDAEALFGSSVILGFKKGNRIARFRKNQAKAGCPAWLDQPGIAPDTWIEFVIEIDSQPIRISSLPGVFSENRLDPGTQFLVDHLTILSDAYILDLGCGYGILGIAGLRRGARFADLMDSNLLAVSAAQKTIQDNLITTARVFPGDALQDGQSNLYTQIITNPPFHAGRSATYQMTHAFIQQSKNSLLPSGEFWLVANRFIPYEELLANHFSKVYTKALSSRYKVIVAQK